MTTIRSLTAALALAFAVPFAGASASDAAPHGDCAETAAAKSLSKADIQPVNKQPEQQAASPQDAAASRLPVNAKVDRDLGQSQRASLPTKTNTAALKAVQKNTAMLPGSCC